MINIKYIKKNLNIIYKKFEIRKIPRNIINKILILNKKKNNLIKNIDFLKNKINIMSKKNNYINNKKNITFKNNLLIIKNKIKFLKNKIKCINKLLNNKLIILPNILDDSVPIGKTENDNIVTKIYNKKIFYNNFIKKPHWILAENLNILDFNRGIKVSKRRFVYYKGLGAILERALYNFMLDTHIYKNGYTELITPYLVNNKTMYGTGQFPKFKNEIFQLKNNNLSLIPTAEVTLVNFYNNEIINKKNLPIYFVSLTPAFRSETGSAGKDKRGIIRLHQFNKVEMVKFCLPENSNKELKKMIKNAEEILKYLNLNYRIKLLCTADTGFSSAITYDLEVWFPGQKKYIEVSSCSNCKDFQARRAMIRYKDNKKINFVHTLNGSGLAIGRIFAAILETHQNKNGTINIPNILHSYMNNIKIIS